MNLELVKGEALFANINKIKKQYKYLTEDMETEVIIVGGGVTGSIMSYYLSKNNIKSILLEKNIIGYGSTSITTALLQYELDGTLRSLEQYTTYDKVIKSYKLGLKALEEIHNFIEEYGNDCDYEVKDTLLYTDKISDVGEIEEEYRLRKENNFDVKLLNEKNNIFNFDLKAGVYGVNGGASLDPYKFTHQLLDVSTNLGGKVYENTEVVGVNYKEEFVEAITKYGFKVKGKVIIVATGYNTGLFSDRKFGNTTITFNIATEQIDNIGEPLSKVLIRDNKVPYNYYRTTYDNRIIGGGQDIEFLQNINNEKVSEEKYKIIEDNINRMFGNNKKLKIQYKYCGAFSSTQDNLGYIGKDPNNDKLWFDLGYGANGILFAILGGIMLSKLYLGESDENLNLFKIDRFDN